MKQGWRWSPIDQPVVRRENLWQLRDALGVVHAEVYKSSHSTLTAKPTSEQCDHSMSQEMSGAHRT